MIYRLGRHGALHALPLNSNLCDTSDGFCICQHYDEEVANWSTFSGDIIKRHFSFSNTVFKARVEALLGSSFVGFLSKLLSGRPIGGV